MTSFYCTLQELLKDFVTLPPALNRTVTGLASDSRKVKKDDVFFAYQGEHVDGRNYIQDAVARGAVAIIAEDESLQIGILEDAVPFIKIPDLSHHVGEIASLFFQHPSRDLPVIGITGTNGKTSTSQFIAASLTALQHPCALIGTLGAGLLPHALISSGFTTPYAIELQHYFAAFKAQAAQAVAMEVSSHALDQGRVAGTRFKGAVFTNLTRDHLDYHPDMAHYAATKFKLFTQPGLEFAVINRDDPVGALWCEQVKVPRVVSYGLSPHSSKWHVFADQIQLYPHGIQAQLHTPWGEGLLKSSLLGRFNLSNLLAALTTLCLMDLPFERVLACINQQKTVNGRMDVVHYPGYPTVVIDYAHTPDALEKALLALREHCDQKLWCVFGCGGDRDAGKRPLMGHIAEQHADHVILTDDNPRHEASHAILSDILVGFGEKKPECIEPSRERAIHYALSHAQASDLILIAGKGHECDQQIGDEKHAFSDKACVKAWFKKVGVQQ